MDIDSTIKNLKEAIKKSPKNLPLRLTLAKLLEENEMIKEASDEYLRATSIESKSVEANLGLGRTLFYLKDYESAIKNLKTVVKQHNAPEAKFYLAKCFLAIDDKEEARKYYEDAVKSDSALKDKRLESQIFEDKALKVSRQGERVNMEDILEIGKPKIKFADVGGLEDLKEEIKMKIIYPFEKSHIFKAYGKKAGGGMLLFGPPGCGKTLIAKATAGECNTNFIHVGITDVLDMWLGESEKKLHEIFETARKESPTILFFDEMDALGGSRLRMTQSTQSTLVNEFLEEMDGISSDNSNVLIVGATNAPWNIDPAFRRPGRFDKIIFVPPPDKEARVSILKIMLKDKPKGRIDSETIADKTEKYSGADLKAVVDTAVDEKIKDSMKTDKIIPLTSDDLIESLEKVKPSTLEWFSIVKNYVTYGSDTGLYESVRKYIKEVLGEKI